MNRTAAERIHVLHVDDEPGFADVVGQFLEREDDRFEVTTATSASEGLEKVGADVDCVVCDYDMPGTNGVEFLEAVREEDENLPFILFTGKGSEDVASEAIAAGVTGYMRKETGTEQYALLANRIANAVTQHRVERRAAETERRWRELSEATNDILWMVTHDWSEVLFINSAYEDIWGRSAERLEEEPRDFLEGIHPDDRNLVRDTMERLSGGESVEVEYRVNPEEGYRRWVWVQGEPIRDEDGTVVRIAGFARDITERKQRARVPENPRQRTPVSR